MVVGWLRDGRGVRVTWREMLTYNLQVAVHCTIRTECVQRKHSAQGLPPVEVRS